MYREPRRWLGLRGKVTDDVDYLASTEPLIPDGMILLAEVDVEELREQLADAVSKQVRTEAELEALKRRIIEAEREHQRVQSTLEERGELVQQYEVQQQEEAAKTSRRRTINRAFLEKLREVEEAEKK